MPKIPFYRDWYEKKFGDLCKTHDEEYVKAKTFTEKYQSDFKFCMMIAKRGYIVTSIFTLIAVNMPWVGKRFRKE